MIAEVQAGHAEIMNMLSPPLIFLALLDSAQGASILFAILSIVREEGIFVHGNGWGLLETNNEQWCDLFLHYKAELTHFYKQLGFNKACCMRGNLKRLSNAKQQVNVSEHGHLSSYKNTQPVIFSALECASGLMTSNSRIAEQTHGGLCDGILAGQ